MLLNFNIVRKYSNCKKFINHFSSYGAGLIRLDAFGHVSKIPGRVNFMNEPETWDILERIKALADPNGLEMIQEIHDCYAERTYFKLAEHGYRIYDFFLPALVIDAFIRNDGSIIRCWGEEIIRNKYQTVNLLCSHDGIPVYDALGLLDRKQIDEVAKLISSNGGEIRYLPAKKDIPYNIGMKIVILDAYTENPGDLSWKALEQFGELTVYDRTPMNDEVEIIRRINYAEIVLTNKTPINARVIDACPSMKFISVLATGYNIVDYKYAAKKGITVSNVPAYGTASVAQFAIALLLEICHHIGHHNKSVHMGKWERSQDFCYWDYPLIELAGKTMGIIGFGRIGQSTGKIASALGMRVLAYDTLISDAGKHIAEYVPLDSIYSESDVIALHCPLFPETKGIINKDSIAKMKNGVILLNNSRGPLIVEQDLADALNSGKVAAAGLDVVSTEPIHGDNPLLAAPNCIITPHISWAPKESRQRIMDCTIENVRYYTEDHPVNVINN